MKHIFIPAFLLFLLPLASTGFAQNVFDRGDREIFVSGNLDTDSFVGSDIDLNLGYGYFVSDLLETGVYAGFRDNDIIGGWDAGVFAEYNWDSGRYWIPYGGAKLGFRAFESDRVDADNSGAELGLYGGVKYLIPGNENISIFGQIGFGYATEDVYDTDDGVEDTDIGLDIGLRYLLPR